MEIWIPSLARANMLSEGPLADLPTNRTINYMVHESEYSDYVQAISELPHARSSNVLVHSTPIKGIARIREYIAKKVTDKTFIMLDDDVRFLVRKSADVWNLRGTRPEEVDVGLHIVEQLMLKQGYDHIGISAREGNNRGGVGAPPLLHDAQRTLRALAFNTNAFLTMEHGRVDVMEDFDIHLQLLRSGHKTGTIYYWAQGQKMTNAPGGCSIYRTHEVHEQSAHRLAELHPGFVRLRQKENKTDREGFGTRTEVTISWKKAAKSGGWEV